MDETDRPELGSPHRRLKLDTLVRLRWLAIAGQTAALVVVHFYLAYPLPLSYCAALVAASAWASIIPAGWSFLLALRSRGLGSVWTTMHLAKEREVAELLDIPSTVTQAALFPVAYTIGTEFRPAARPPAETITFFDGWGEG